MIITGELIPGDFGHEDLKVKYLNHSLLKNVIKNSKFNMSE
jgi:hypothetical protein